MSYYDDKFDQMVRSKPNLAANYKRLLKIEGVAKEWSNYALSDNCRQTHPIEFIYHIRFYAKIMSKFLEDEGETLDSRYGKSGKLGKPGG